MFRRLTEPLPLSEASLLALRPALNTPVLNVGFLPVGPARAAIVAFAEEYGGIGMALGIRSNEGGQVVVIRNQESLDFDTAIPSALEPLLEEAERMGFLFDEDMLVATPGDQGRSQAMGLWGRLMGELEIPAAARTVRPQPAANEPILPPSGSPVEPAPALDAAASVAQGEVPEFELEDLADFETEPVAEIDLTLEDALPPQTPAPAPDAKPAEAPTAVAAKRGTRARPAKASREAAVTAPRRPEQSARQSSAPAALEADSPAALPPTRLSKFRHAEQLAARTAALPSPPADPDSDDVGPNNALGRIPLVRVRREREGSKRVPFIARLLASF